MPTVTKFVAVCDLCMEERLVTYTPETDNYHCEACQ